MFDDDVYKKYNLDELTKGVLFKDPDLAMGLARCNSGFGRHDLAQDFEVLGLNDGMVAKLLAKFSDVNGWGETSAAQDFEVLSLGGGAVAEWLAACAYSGLNDWGETPAAQKKKVKDLMEGNVGNLLDKRINKKDKVNLSI